MTARIAQVPLDGPVATQATAYAGATSAGDPATTVRLYGHQVDVAATVTDPDVLLELAAQLTAAAQAMVDQQPRVLRRVS